MLIQNKKTRNNFGKVTKIIWWRLKRENYGLFKYKILESNRHTEDDSNDLWNEISSIIRRETKEIIGEFKVIRYTKMKVGGGIWMSKKQLRRKEQILKPPKLIKRKKSKYNLAIGRSRKEVGQNLMHTKVFILDIKRVREKYKLAQIEKGKVGI